MVKIDRIINHSAAGQYESPKNFFANKSPKNKAYNIHRRNSQSSLYESPHDIINGQAIAHMERSLLELGVYKKP